jgi:hypothetical protein
VCRLSNDSGVWTRCGAQNAVLTGDDVKVNSVITAAIKFHVIFEIKQGEIGVFTRLYIRKC